MRRHCSWGGKDGRGESRFWRGYPLLPPRAGANNENEKNVSTLGHPFPPPRPCTHKAAHLTYATPGAYSSSGAPSTEKSATTPPAHATNSSTCTCHLTSTPPPPGT